MCGIAGIISLSNGSTIVPQWLQTMADTLRHRGPDDEGFVFFDADDVQCFGGNDTPDSVNNYQLSVNCNYESRISYNQLRTTNYQLAFAHRRLSILDTSALGHQPMSDQSRRYWICFNGEIYNYQEIRQELISLGHHFVSNSDTEVIIQSYIRWGDTCVQRFNGMWAFAIYDRQTQTFFCSRDRFGVKPFYYFRNEDFFAFASEQKALLTLPFVKKKLNEEAVFDFLVLGNTEQHAESFFKGILELKAGHNLHIQHGILKIEKYYQLAYTSSFGNFSDKTAHNHSVRVKELLEDAVRFRLRSDVPVGACLSGGVDSSALVCIANALKTGDAPFHVFTAVYPGQEVDESGWAQKVVEATGASWHTVETKPLDLLQQYEDVIYSQDIPFFGSSTLSQYKVMELIGQTGIKVTLDGQGADEMFSGYSNHVQTRALHDLISLNFADYKSLQQAEPKLLEHLLRFASKRTLFHLPFGIGYKYMKNTKYDFELLDAAFWNKYSDRYYSQKRPSIQNLNEVLHHEYTGGQLQYLMRTADRNSMRHSVESRVPFADDHRLAEYVFSIPSTYKMHAGRSKYLLRQSMKGGMPEEIRQRWDKKGFATPEYRWFKSLKNELKELVGENLEPFVNISQLHKDWDSIFENQLAGNTLGISRFVILSMWRKRFGV